MAINQEPETIMITEVPRAVKYPGLREPVSGRPRATAALLREVRLMLTLEKEGAAHRVGGREELPAQTGRMGPLENAGWEWGREEESQVSRQGPVDRHRPPRGSGEDSGLQPKAKGKKHQGFSGCKLEKGPAGQGRRLLQVI